LLPSRGKGVRREMVNRYNMKEIIKTSPQGHLEPGKYRFTGLVATLATSSHGLSDYESGDVLELMSQTDQNPHGFIGEDVNWVVKCKHFQSSIWSSIGWMIENGWLVRM
jgi:hypothetical protein